jgi:hypothetical protein
VSHTATVRVAFTEVDCIGSACAQIGATFDPVVKDVKLYGSQKITGRTVQLDGWRYPCVISPDGQTLSYDNMNGHWGKIEKLNEFKAAYAAAVSLKELNTDLDMTDIHRETLPDGWIKITAETLA